MKTRELTYERLKEKIHYDPETGKFTRTWPDHNRKVGQLDKDGYLAIAIDRVKHRAGRLAWLYMTGEHPDESMHVDHINRIRDDNRWVNLRLLTPAANQAHRVVTRKPPASGVSGVYWDGRKNRWFVQVFRNRRIHYGGSHKTIDAAAKAADALRARLDTQSAA
jgi:hypothetical protein